MLQLRPTCEHCNKNLPPDSTEAMICSFECTFCKSCATILLENVCPNCGGGFTQRPVRPKGNLKNHNNLDAYPATNKVVHRPVHLAEHAQFAKKIKNISPEKR